MATILDRIIEAKRKEFEAARQRRPLRDLHVAIVRPECGTEVNPP